MNWPAGAAWISGGSLGTISSVSAGARYLMPVHHQTFKLSFEPFREPIERFIAALREQPHRIALREIGETFVLEN